MEITPVSPASASSVRSAMMEQWRISMGQKLSQDVRQRINGQARYHSQDIMVNSVGSENVHSREDKDRPRPVEPAVRVAISQQAWEVAKKQQ